MVPFIVISTDASKNKSGKLGGGTPSEKLEVKLGRGKRRGLAVLNCLEAGQKLSDGLEAKLGAKTEGGTERFRDS